VIEVVRDRGVEQLAQELDESAPLSVETDLFSTNLKPLDYECSCLLTFLRYHRLRNLQ
jgi:hypothetical protein